MISPRSRIDMVEALPNFERIQYAKDLHTNFDLINWPDEVIRLLLLQTETTIEMGQVVRPSSADLRELALWIVPKKKSARYNASKSKSHLEVVASVLQRSKQQIPKRDPLIKIWRRRAYSL